jgi:N-acetylmuramic acid 6-phosphate etherase
MIDMKASNFKLDQRAKSILRTLTRHDNRVYSDEELGQLLQSCSGSVKLAAAALMLQLPVDEASVRLRNSHGVLSKALQGNTTDSEGVTEDVVLCVDAGGSGCKATIVSRGGNAGSGVSRPCNV